MKRRDALLFLACLGVTWPIQLRAQPAARIHRVGVFSTTARAGVWHLHQALIESLQQLGYGEGRNIIIEHLQRQFTSISEEGVDGMLVFSDGLTYARRRDIIAFATLARLPTMYGSRESVDDGGLISYGVNLSAIYRRAASFIDKILRGA